MRNRWRSRVAGAGRGTIGEVVKASRLLGAETALVLHGGGNSSIKRPLRRPDSTRGTALLVKASGCDMAALETGDLTVLDLAPIRALAKRKTLSDAHMIRAGRSAKMDPDSPDPSVEYLLHAFLPDAVILHTHSDAVLALTNQPDGQRLAERTFAKRAVVVPYAKSGFALALAAERARNRHPEAEALVVLRHGLFTFGATATEAYDRMIALVTLAERRLARARHNPFPARASSQRTAPLAAVAPIVRGALAAALPGNDFARVVLDFRASPAIRRFLAGRDLARYAQAGPATPDHVIWTKPKPLILPVPATDEMDGFKAQARTAAARFRDAYAGYAARHGAPGADATPRIVLVPGLGLFGAGKSAREAAVAADLFTATVGIVERAEALGRYRPATATELAEIEFWEPERLKLRNVTPPPLAGQVVVITGGGSGIGAATARAFAAEGALVAVLDKDGRASARVGAEIGGLARACDVTDARDVRAAFAAIAERFGGADIVVSNAGAAWSGEIGTVADEVLRASFELNFFAHQYVAQAAVAVMRAQGTGGVLLFNASKQAMDPGPNFGPYGAPKAALLSLMRHYALDHGKDGIRANAVNADRIRSGLLDDAMIAARSKARGITREHYMAGNVLKRETTAEDVARAFVALAKSHASTGAILTVDGGNLAAAVR